MGLDSVTLLMEFETGFGIEIPDAVAAKLFTSKDVVDYVTGIRKLDVNLSVLECRTMQKLAIAIRDFCRLPVLPEAESIVGSYKSSQPELFRQFLEQRLALAIPSLPIVHSTRLTEFLMRNEDSIFRSPYHSTRLRTLNDAINAYNFRFEPGAPGLQTSYEAYLVVMCILSEKIGLDLLELAPDKAFVNDYGID